MPYLVMNRLVDSLDHSDPTMSTVSKNQSGCKRPYVDAQAAIRVEQYADKKSISYREAYTEVIEMVLDEEGRVKE